MRPTFERPEMYLLLFAAALLGAAAETLDFCVDDGTWTTVAGSGAWAFGSSYGGEDCLLEPTRANGGGARAWTDGRSWGDAATTFRVINTNLRRQAGVYARLAALGFATNADADKLLAKFTGYGCFLYVDNDGTAASGGGTLRLVRGDYDSHAVLATSDAVVWRRDVWADVTLRAVGGALSCAYVPSDGAAATEVAADDSTYASGAVGANVYRQETTGGARNYYFERVEIDAPRRRRRAAAAPGPAAATPAPTPRPSAAAPGPAAPRRANAAAHAGADAAADSRRPRGGRTRRRAAAALAAVRAVVRS